MAKNILFDVHGHPQFSVYDNDRDAVIGRAREAGIKMIAVGTDFSTSQAAVNLSHRYPDDIWAAVGHHPSRLELFDIDQIRKLAGDERVVVIGECGLDYYRLVESEKSKVKSLQKEVFREQLNLALDLKKPLMVHCRPSKGTQDSYLDLMELIGKASLDLPVILHFYAGSLEITKKFVDRGFYFTFGGAITFSDDYNESINNIPMERIMPETDCPYVAPVPYRGKRNEPLFVTEVIRKLAEIKNMPLSGLTEKISGTVNKIFKI